MRRLLVYLAALVLATAGCSAHLVTVNLPPVRIQNTTQAEEAPVFQEVRP